MEREWVRGALIGKGSFGTVHIAIPMAGAASGHGLPSHMAVKSSPLSHSSFLRNEEAVLSQLQDCPHILSFFFHDVTTEASGNTLYNVLLEYAEGGSLADRLARSRMPDSDVRRYTRSILEGLAHIHRKGFVHCDIKPSNLLLTSSDEVRIADFGLAGKVREEAAAGDSKCLRGTPLYIAPECVARGAYAPAADVWSLGCVVAEMAAGKPAWSCGKNSDANALLYRIGFGGELPEIPWELSEAGKDFLGKCFMRDPEQRWTAEMLLNHPFVAAEVAAALGGDSGHLITVEKMKSLSPRSAFDFNSWAVSIHSSMRSTITWADSCLKVLGGELRKFEAAADRIRRLRTGPPPPSQISSWGEGEWITVREAAEPSSSLQCGEAGPKGNDSEEIMTRKRREEGMDSNATSTSPDSSNQETKLGSGSIYHPCKAAAAAGGASRNSYDGNADHVRRRDNSQICVSAPDSLSLFSSISSSSNCIIQTEYNRDKNF